MKIPRTRSLSAGVGTLLIAALASFPTSAWAEDPGRPDTPLVQKTLGGDSWSPERGAGGAPFTNRRVAGLSIVINDDQVIAGTRQVDFDVLLTTERINLRNITTGSAFSGVTYDDYEGLWRAYQGSIAFQLSNVAVTFNRPQLGRLDDQATLALDRAFIIDGTLVESLSAPRGVANGTTALFDGAREYRLEAGSINQQIAFASTGLLPAIDFGDGSTIPATSLTTTVSTTDISTGTATGIGGLGLKRTVYRRAGLSHLYGDLAPYTIRIASGCCADAEGAVTGSALITGSFLFTGTEQESETETAIRGSFTFDSESVQAFNTTASATPLTYQTSDPISESSQINSTLPVAVLTATATVGGILAVPTTNSLGLAALALMLSVAGVYLMTKR